MFEFNKTTVHFTKATHDKQTNTTRLLCASLTVSLYTENIKIKSTLQSKGKGVGANVG